MDFVPESLRDRTVCTATLFLISRPYICSLDCSKTDEADIATPVHVANSLPETHFSSGTQAKLQIFMIMMMRMMFNNTNSTTTTNNNIIGSQVSITDKTYNMTDV